MLEAIRETWASIPPGIRILGGLLLFWGLVFLFYQRKPIN
jgi:hypothetical protein